MKIALHVSDIQGHFADMRALRAVQEFAGSMRRLDTLIYNGDIVDFYDLSAFDKDPNRGMNLGMETTFVKDKILGEFDKALKDVPPGNKKRKVYFNDGNHEDRLRRYLWKRPELHSLPELTIPSLLELGDTVEYHPYGEGFWLNPEFFVVHGNIVRSKSSYTARAMYERYLCSGISGHSHRLGSYYNVANTSKGPKTFGWWEGGCLCNLSPEYVHHPQWQQGFHIIYYQDDGRFQVTQVPILDGKFVAEGKTCG